MRVWMAKMMALALMGSATIAGAAGCPVALDFYKRPLLDEKPVHLCEEFRGRVVASFPSQVDPQDKRLIAVIDALL